MGEKTKRPSARTKIVTAFPEGKGGKEPRAGPGTREQRMEKELQSLSGGEDPAQRGQRQGKVA